MRTGDLCCGIRERVQRPIRGVLHALDFRLALQDEGIKHKQLHKSPPKSQRKIFRLLGFVSWCVLCGWLPRTHTRSHNDQRECEIAARTQKKRKLIRKDISNRDWRDATSCTCAAHMHDLKSHAAAAAAAESAVSSASHVPMPMSKQ